MPEKPDDKFRPQVMPCDVAALPASELFYAELAVRTNFSFLRGASHPEELVIEAKRLGHAALAVTDTGTFAGIVRAHVAAKEAQLPLLVGVRVSLRMTWGLEMQDIQHPASHVKDQEAQPPAAGSTVDMILMPHTKSGYARLCEMLTRGKRRTEKGKCDLSWMDLEEFSAKRQTAWQGILVPPDATTWPTMHRSWQRALEKATKLFSPDHLSVLITRHYRPHEPSLLARVLHACRETGVPPVVGNDVLYHHAERHMLQDILTCIREGCTIDQAGTKLQANSERHLKSPEEMWRLFADMPAAFARIQTIAHRAMNFSLDHLTYEYPHEICPQGKTQIGYLRELTYRHAKDKFGIEATAERGDVAVHGIKPQVVAQLEHELAIIEELNYASYFLTVYDIVQFARSRGILCQGRGAAANSSVCFCLGITNVDPTQLNLLVERFISRERNEPPDIDIDFEHERREEVIQYIYERYGRHRAAICAEVITYRRRSAVRDVGKALGFSLDAVDRLAKSHDWWTKEVAHEETLHAMGFDPRAPRMQLLIKLASDILGFPRHLSQHVGGMIITENPLWNMVPVENAAMPDRTVIEWDKDDIDAMGMLKIDILGLGMLTAIRKALDLIENVNVNRPAAGSSLNPQAPLLALNNLPLEDPHVYEMLCRADSIGVFQVESRAQMSMLPRLKPRCFYDLVIEVAIVRPGPIQGGMVHPYLKRRNKEEKEDYPNDEIKAVLERTLGVPLFQEQVMRLAMVAAGFTGGQADQLRRAMAAWKRKGHLIEKFVQMIISGMLARGYTREFADQLCKQIHGFGEYGFPESHAASFAHLVYASAWLKCYHPAAFCAALINSQPMGFYQPSQLIRDAQQHGVTVLPIDVNYSSWNCTLEKRATHAEAALRLGFRLVRGVRLDEIEKIINAVQRRGAFRDVLSLWRASGVKVTTLRKLAAADVFNSMNLDRQHALWQVQALHDAPLPLLDRDDLPLSEHSPSNQQVVPASVLPIIQPSRLVIHDYAATGLSLKGHPLQFVRQKLSKLGLKKCADLHNSKSCPDGSRVGIAGLVLVRQRPGTASGILFVTVEDETGVANLVIRPHIYEQFKHHIRHAIALAAWGHVERGGPDKNVLHLIVRKAMDVNYLRETDSLLPTHSSSRNFH